MRASTMTWHGEVACAANPRPRASTSREIDAAFAMLARERHDALFGAANRSSITAADNSLP